MPGETYLDSIIHFWRVYAGATIQAADRCEEFLTNIVDVERFPLMRLSSMTASETAKVMENSYRAAGFTILRDQRPAAERQVRNAEERQGRCRDVH